MTVLDDQRLVQDFKSSRNGECFAPLFLRYNRRVFVVAYAFHRNHSQAEDCVQETFLRAFAEIDRYDETTLASNFWAWLRTITRNVCIDDLRRKQHRTLFTEQAISETTPATQEEAVMLQELREHLKALPQEYRMSYLLSTEGYSYKEIMGRTGFSYDQVKTFIQTTKRHLSRQFPRERRSA